MAKSMQEQLKEMSPWELKEFIILKKKQIVELVDAAKENGRSVMGVQPKIKLILSAYKLLGRSDEDLKQIRLDLYSSLPHYRTLTAAEKEEKTARSIDYFCATLDTSNYSGEIKPICRRLGYFASNRGGFRNREHDD